MDDDLEPTTAPSQVRAWIGALIASLALLGGYALLQEQLHPSASEDDGEALAAEDASPKAKKRTRRKRKKRKRRRGKRDAASSPEDDEAFELIEPGDDPYVLGDVSERYEDERPSDARRPQAPPPLEPPPKELWDPGGAYRPKARYVEKGLARLQVSTLDMSARGGGGGARLTPSQIKRVTRVADLMPCYREAAQRAPKMRGRVKMNVVVAPDGHVAKVVLTRSELRSRIVERCIVDRAKQWRFPRAKQATGFDTHFDFR